jgi:hypothetical protein
MEKNAIKLAQMLELDTRKAQKFMDLISLSDMAALTTALNTGDMQSVKTIYSKYQSQIESNTDADAVRDHYEGLIKSGTEEQEALVSTADFFGITGEEVEAVVGIRQTQETAPFIPDEQVEAAYNNVQEMLDGKPSRGIITELNTWQRRMFYGLIPNAVAKVIQDTIDMTPIAVMQKHAKEMGYGEPAIKESEMSLAEMIEKIIEKELNKIKQKVEEEPVVMTMDLGTIQAKEEPEKPKVDDKTKKLIQSIVLRRF